MVFVKVTDEIMLMNADITKISNKPETEVGILGTIITTETTITNQDSAVMTTTEIITALAISTITLTIIIEVIQTTITAIRRVHTIRQITTADSDIDKVPKMKKEDGDL